MAQQGSAFTAEDWTSYENWKPEFLTKVVHVEDRYFLSSAGYYVAQPEEEQSSILDVRFVHKNLLKLGAHVFVEIAKLGAQYRRRFQHARARKHVRGWIRYPDEADRAADAALVYVCLRVMRMSGQKLWNVELLGVAPDACLLPDDAIEAVQYMLPPSPVA